MAKRMKRMLRLLLENWRTILGFEVLYKLLGIAVGVPLFAGSLYITMQISGYTYLTFENMLLFIKNPVTILSFILMILLLCLYAIFDISALVYVAAYSHEKIQVTIWQTTRFAWKSLCRVMNCNNLLMIPATLLLLLYLNVGTFASFAATVTIPGFVRSICGKNMNYILLAVILTVALGFRLTRNIYVYHYFLLEDCDFLSAMKKSHQLSKRKRWKDFLTLAAEQLLFYACYFLVVAVGILLVLGVAKLFLQLKILTYVYTSAVWGLLMVILALVASIGTPLSFACISILFYLHKESSKEEVLLDNMNILRVQSKTRKKVYIVQGCLMVAAFIICTFLIYRSATERINPQIEYIRTIEVTAHRGSSAFYPENTMAAFQGAVEFNADWIELDVQQSKDGQIFVMHDHNFYRTTGVNRYSWETDYSEIEKLDAGSFFSDTFAGEKIPLLSDVITFAKENDIKLNIELKPTGNDMGMEKRVVDLITEMEFADSCVVSSQIYSSLEKVKEYNPEIQTLYVMSLAYGNVNKLSAADAFSMEAGSVTPGMVSRIHNAGKLIFVWTVNSRKVTNRMVDLNVDNIITDRIPMVQQAIYENKTNDVIQRYVRMLRGQ